MLTDLRHAVRVLGKARGWTVVVLASLALGIGANTALFSAVDGMLFRTLPVADPDGLVRLRWSGDNGAARNVTSFGATGGMGVPGSFSYPVFEALRDANETLAGMFAATPTSLTLVVDGRAEIGVRMALGAPSTGIAWMVLRESLVLVAAGVAAGVGAVLLAEPLVASMIHGLAPTDPVTIVQAAILLAGIAAAAAWLPARRAARVDPLTALQDE